MMNNRSRGLPGGDLVAAGMDALHRGEETVEGLLVAIGAPRLRRLGLALPPKEALPGEPELRLYRRLVALRCGAAHSRYNALVRRLVSFERALERERRMRAVLLNPDDPHYRAPRV